VLTLLVRQKRGEVSVHLPKDAAHLGSFPENLNLISKKDTNAHRKWSLGGKLLRSKVPNPIHLQMYSISRPHSFFRILERLHTIVASFARLTPTGRYVFV
jgi:hypothetical protein